MIQKISNVVWYYDFYGEMLTEKQQQIFKLYYFHDLSMGEIAEEYKISRQAVHDILKRSEDILIEYEKKLRLFEKFTEQKEIFNKLQDLLCKIHEKSNDKDIKKCIHLLNDLVDSIT